VNVPRQYLVATIQLKDNVTAPRRRLPTRHTEIDAYKNVDPFRWVPMSVPLVAVIKNRAALHDQREGKIAAGNKFKGQGWPPAVLVRS
jgi:hypothetical protein